MVGSSWKLLGISYSKPIDQEVGDVSDRKGVLFNFGNPSSHIYMWFQIPE